MGNLISGIEFLNIPMTIAATLVGLFLILQIIGEILEFDDEGCFTIGGSATSNIALRNGSAVIIEGFAYKLGNATAADVVAGKTFTSENGVNIVGTYEAGSGSDSTLTVYTGAAGESPSPSLGSDGDIYIKVV